jgi:hypothetical protein
MDKVRQEEIIKALQSKNVFQPYSPASHAPSIKPSFGGHFPWSLVSSKMAKAFMNRGYTATDENGASSG